MSFATLEADEPRHDLTEELRAKGWMLRDDVAQLLGTAPKYVDLLGSRGAIPYTKMGHMRLYRRDDVLEYQRTHPRIGRTAKRRRGASL